MDLLAAKLGAKMAINELTASGQIGSEGIKSFSSAYTPYPTEFAKFPDDVKMPEGVIGMTANVKFAGEGYYFLNNPKENRDEDYYFPFNSNDPADPDFWFIANNTGSGRLNKRSFGIGGNVSKVCPTFGLNYPEYTNIAYFYEPTSDNLGLGMTVPAGWFALNTNTFALTPFDLANNPVIVPSDFTPVTANGNAGMDFIKANWFELKKEISFVIKEKNLLIHEGIGNVCFADISALRDVNDEIAAKLGTTCVFVFHESGTESGHKWLLLLPETVEYITLTYSGGIKPIDGKYLPKGGVGYGESVTITYDGNGEKVDILGNGETYAKASSEYVNGNNISKIVRAVAGNDGEIVGENVYTKDELSIEVTDIATMVSYNDTLLLISAAADVEGYLEKGTYVFDKVMGVEGDMAHTWISSIEYGEIHTIDPKYLFPHFDLAAMGLETVTIGGDSIYLTLDDPTPIIDAMKRGVITASFNVNFMGTEIVANGAFTCFYSPTVGTHQGTFFMYNSGSAVLFSLVIAGNELGLHTKVIA